jgi:hypothetical protein
VSAAAVVLLAACGGSGNSAADSSAATAAGETTGGGSGSDFCAQAAEIDQRVESAMSNLETDDPSVEAAFRQVAEELRAIDPPAEISSDWEAMAGGLDQMADAFAAFDVTDAESLAALDEAEADLSTAATNVENYLQEECGINP